MIFLIKLLIPLFICLVLSYLLGKPILKALFPYASALLYIPFGFVVFQILFFCSSVVFVYKHGNWDVVAFVASFIVGLALLFAFMNFNLKEEVKKLHRLSRMQKWGIIFLIVLGFVHGFLQVSFWNADNSMSDNAFYVSIATAARHNQALFAINPADGMEQSLLMTDYFMSTYEISLTYLAGIFGFHPAAFMRLIMPFWLSIATVLTVFVIFQQLLLKESLAYVGIILYFVYFYFSPNYMSSLNDYTLEEWFLYYYYVGKAVARYLIIPLLISLMIYSKRYFDFGTMTTKRIITHAIAFNALGLCAMIVSPAASLYYLAIVFVYFLVMLFNERYNLRQVVSLGLVTSIAGCFGVLLSIWTKLISNESLIAGSGAVKLSWKTFLGTEGRYFTPDVIGKFFINGQPFENGWYPRWPHIVLSVATFLFLLTWVIYQYTMRGGFKKEVLDVLGRKMPTAAFFERHHALFFFGIGLPLVYFVFYHLPPFVEVITMVIDGFGFERLVGAYPYEIMMVSLLIVAFCYFQQVLLPRIAPDDEEKLFARLLTSLFVVVFAGLFVLIPARPVTYLYAMSPQRQEYLKFHDGYYNGSFNYQRLANNPYKLDYQAEQIVQKLSQIEGEKIVAGTINQFFGLSHVRNVDSSISVVRTRYSRYVEQYLVDAAYILRVYFTPWEAQFVEYQKRYTPADVIDALEAFDVNYLILLKTETNAENFGGKMMEAFRTIITHVDETEQYYILQIDPSSVEQEEENGTGSQIL